MGTTTFVWDPVFDCVTHELDENNDVKAVYHNEPQQYGELLSQRRGTTTHYHHHDALGSTRFLTDSSGNVTDTYLHDAWGNEVASTGTTVNPFKWVGKYGYYSDNSTGLVYVRARMYQPTLARWLSVDPLKLRRLRRAFSYAQNAPQRYLDPSGLLEAPQFPWPNTQDLTARIFTSETTCQISLRTPILPYTGDVPTSDTLRREHFVVNEDGQDTSAETYSEIYVSRETSWIVCCHQVDATKCNPRCNATECCVECSTDGAKTVRAYFVSAKSSWNGPARELVLRHERYHLRIAELYACKIRNADPGPQVTTACDSQKAFAAGQASWNKSFEQAHDKLIEEYHAFQRKYDDDVDHENIDPDKQIAFERIVDEMKKKHCG